MMEGLGFRVYHARPLEQAPVHGVPHGEHELDILQHARQRPEVEVDALLGAVVHLPRPRQAPGSEVQNIFIDYF